uniref:Uncharacterized protein n=1 Tax=viral metagenome TaxID=1070528 RepID=A0A2V0R9L9_9ZZZZ
MPTKKQEDRKVIDCLVLASRKTGDRNRTDVPVVDQYQKVHAILYHGDDVHLRARGFEHVRRAIRVAGFFAKKGCVVDMSTCQIDSLKGTGGDHYPEISGIYIRLHPERKLFIWETRGGVTII